MTTRAREVEARLRELAADEEAHPYSNAGPELTEAADTISALIAECETAKAELAEAVKVVEPFADYLKQYPDSGSDSKHIRVGVQLAVLRATRAFIAKHTPPQPVPVGEEKGETK